MKSFLVGASLATLVCVNVSVGVAQTAEDFKALREELGVFKEIQELRREMEALKAGQQGVQKDLQEIKTLLQNRPGAAAATAPAIPQNLTFDLDGAVVKGEKTAKLVLVEFTDIQCPFCARHVKDTAPQIDKAYIESGKLKYVVRDFPLESIHKNAFKAAEATRCAQDQGKFWEMHHRLFENQQTLSPEDLLGHAKALEMKEEDFKKCLDEDTYAASVRKDMAEGQKAGVTGTPAFFIGAVEGDNGKVKVMQRLTGAQPFSAFQAAIDSALAEQK